MPRKFAVIATSGPEPFIEAVRDRARSEGLSIYALTQRALEQYLERETPGGDPGVSETASSDLESLCAQAYSVR
jgi:hypothetical protein